MVTVVAAGFLVQVIQELVLALGVALAGANGFAFLRSRSAHRRWEEEVAKAKAVRGERGKVPPEPPVVAAGPALVNVAVGVAIALVALASLTLDWAG